MYDTTIQAAEIFISWVLVDLLGKYYIIFGPVLWDTQSYHIWLQIDIVCFECFIVVNLSTKTPLHDVI